MSMGFYGWIRDGVRRAVLMGFSDAVDQLGPPAASEEVHPQLAAVLKQSRPLLTAGAAPVAEPPRSQGGRKRLGRSLNQIQAEANVK